MQPAMLRLFTRVMPLVAQATKSQQMRTIYSESYLGIEALRGIRGAIQLTLRILGAKLGAKVSALKHSKLRHILQL